MAYGIKYKADFKDNYNRNFKVELLKKGYSGSVTTIVNLAPSLVEISYEGERGKLKNVQGSALNFGFYETPGDDFEDLFITAYRDYKLNFINVDQSTLIWTGYIKPENLSKSYFDKNKLISLQATDALADLKDISFEKISNTSSPILSVVKDALDYTGIELPIRTQINTYEINYMTRGQDPLKESYIKTRKFVTSKDNNNTYDNANDVITRLLQPFNSQLKQENGRYVIFNHNEIDSSIHNYDWDTLTQQSITNSNNIVDLNTYKFHTSGDYSKIKPIRYVDLMFKNIDDGGPLINGIENWDDASIWNLPSAYHYVEDDILVIGTSTDVSVSLVPGIDGGNPVTGKEYIKFSVDVLVEPFDPPKESGSGDFIDLDIYLKPAGGSWNKVQSFFVERSLNYTTYSSTLTDDWKITSASNDPYQFYILFDAPTVSNDMVIRTKNPSLTKVNAIDVSAGTSNISTIGFDRVFTGDISINYGTYEDTLYFGDCETITERSNITIGTTNNSEKWSTYNRDISNNIQIIYTQTLLNNNQKYRDYISVEVLDPSYNINSNSIIKINDKNYVITRYERNYKRGDIKLDIEELVTTVAPNFKFAAKSLASVDGVSITSSNTESGTSGVQGTQGTQGTQGIQGRQGIQGPQGIQGRQGTQGSQGTQGEIGLQGTRGIRGYTGLPGEEGPQGIQGIQGTRGPQGIQGSQGIQGTQGALGDQGERGLQGTRGTIGTSGSQGIQGIQGTQGTRGPQGIQGAVGTPPTANIVTTTANYSIPPAYMGYIFEVSSASARSIYVPAGSVTGDQIAIINIGTGIVTISPSTGSGAPTLKGLGTRLKSRWSAASAYYNNTYNNWTLIGDVST